MKIEKLNDNQIRCTLTREDLEQRELKLSELAYGSDKAKMLFREMMQQASYEFGFEAEEIPLMIEAVPLSPECIILTITKVEDPDELDTRFSKFTSSKEDTTPETHSLEGADGILDLYRKIREEKKKLDAQKQQKNTTSTNSPTPNKDISTQNDDSDSLDLMRIYSIQNLDTVTELSYILKGFYNGKNSLFKDPVSNNFWLVLSKSQHTPEEYNKVCNIVSEYGYQERHTNATEAFLEEHMEVILKQDALQTLSKI